MKPLLRRFCRCSDVVSSHRAALLLLHLQPSSLFGWIWLCRAGETRCETGWPGKMRSCARRQRCGEGTAARPTIYNRYKKQEGVLHLCSLYNPFFLIRVLYVGALYVCSL